MALAFLLVTTFAVACGSEKDDGNVVTDAGPRRGKAAALTKSKGKPTKVEIPKAPVTELDTEDLKAGKGEAAAKGKQVTVNYVGIACSSGKEFDSSWGKKGKNKDDPLKFVLGTGKVIKGWDQGLVGMKEGGVRRLVIPGDLAYGPTGQPPDISGNDTPIFVVELVKVEKAPRTTTTTTTTAAPTTTTTSAPAKTTTTRRSGSRSTTTTTR